MKNTKEIIQERALDLFNEKGIEYGGMRELAKLLNMRVSNITYYFPTKDDLIEQLMKGLRTLNMDTQQKYEAGSLKNFMQMYREMFGNQYAYRCLMMSFVHLFTHHKELAEKYKQIEKNRRLKLVNTFDVLISSGYFKSEKRDETVQKLVGQFSLLTRFWISESIVSYYDKTTEEIIAHYLTMMCDLLQPYTTAKGKKDIGEFLKELH